MPTNTRRWANVGLMLVERRKLWANIETAQGQRLVNLFSITHPAIYIYSVLSTITSPNLIIYIMHH